MGSQVADTKSVRENLCRAVGTRVMGDDNMRYINVAIGRLDELAVAEEVGAGDEARRPSRLTKWWQDRGWSVMPDPAPVLRSTLAGSTPLAMPWHPGSLATRLRAHIVEAAEQAPGGGEIADQDETVVIPMSLGGKPKWGSHSCRRGGAKRARDLAHLWGASPDIYEDINRHFGWLEEAMKGGRKRQAAYASTLPVQRRIRVTKKW